MSGDEYVDEPEIELEDQSGLSTFPDSAASEPEIGDDTRVTLLDGMDRKRRRFVPVECECAGVSKVCRCMTDQANMLLSKCVKAESSRCIVYILLVFFAALVTLAIVVIVSAEESATDDSSSGMSDTSASDIPSSAIMIHLEANDVVQRHSNNVAIGFVLRHVETGDLVSIDCNMMHQRVERYSSEDGRLLIGSYDGMLVGDNTVCGAPHRFLDESYARFVAGQDGNAFVYVDQSQWVIEEVPTIRFVDHFSWGPLHDCDAVREDVQTNASEVLADVRMRSEAYARQLLQPMWTMSQASVQSVDDRESNWGQFWEVYERIRYDTSSDEFIVAKHTGGTHPVAQLVPEGTTHLTPRCTKSSLVYDGLVTMCEQLYVCSSQQVHSAPDGNGWDCYCLLQTFSFAISRVSCSAQDAECFARLYAWARIWDAIPCHTVGTCQTQNVSLPLQVQSNGLVQDVEEHVDFGCIEQYYGGLQTYRDQF